MPYVLSRETKWTRESDGAQMTGRSYHVGFLGGVFPEGSSRVGDARTFHGKALAEVYARNKGLDRRGYKPEKISA